MSDVESARLGARLAAQGDRLRLLMHHLAGPALRARVEVEDLVGEVFLRALESPGAVPPEEPGEGPLRAHLTRLSRRVVIDLVRALRAAKRSAREAPLARSDWSHAGVRESELAREGAGIGTRLDQREELQRLAAAFRALAPDHRRVIGLRQFEGLDAREAARRMGRSEVALHSLYRRALLAWETAAERGKA